MFWLNINFIFTWFKSSKYEIYIIYSAQLIKQIGVGHEIQTGIKKKILIMDHLYLWMTLTFIQLLGIAYFSYSI